MSVVIPVHNEERFVAESVRSVLAQTLPVAECVAVDDGSTDGTLDVLREFGSDLRVVQQARAGVAAARNAGVRATRGELVAFLDADDIWAPEKLERQLRALETSTAVGSYTGYVIASEHLRPRRVVVHPDDDARPAVERALLLEGAGLGFSFTGLARRAALESTGGFDERLSTTADLELAWRLHRLGGLTGVPEPLAVHRQHAPSQMHRDISRMVREMSAVIATAGSRGLPDEQGRRALRNVEVHAAAKRLLRGELSEAVSGLGRVATRRPASTARLLAAAAVERTRQHARVVTLRRLAA